MTGVRKEASVLVAWALALSSCTTIGPTVPVGPGAGKSQAGFDEDRRTCMAQADQVLQPVAIRANLQAATAQEMAASNRRIQVAYDEQYGSCMTALGNLVPAPAAPLPSQPMPPTPEVALEGPLPVSDASNTPALSDADSLAAERSIGQKVRALLAACPGETIAVSAHEAPLAPGVTARLLALTQPDGGGCLGHIGESDFLVARVPGGTWRILLSAEPGSLGIRTAGHGGYREVELRSFGTCVYRYRWNGRAFYPADSQDCTLPAPLAPGGYADRIRGH